MSRFLRNCWYVAAWADEVSVDKPFAPLSLGRVTGDRIVCGYHGLGFDGAGNCTDGRVNSATRSRAQVRAFPLVEKHRALWIWMGDSAKADPTLIADFAFLDDASCVVVKGLTHVRSHYSLEVDNLMDLNDQWPGHEGRPADTPAGWKYRSLRYAVCGRAVPAELRAQDWCKRTADGSLA
jgi:vanillate O-demethylase monooxygenase subunit